MQTHVSPAMILGATLCMVLLAACNTTSPSAQGPGAADAGPAHYIVTAETTSFYKYGPAQASGPDLRLKKDQVVTMIERHYGYSRVVDPDGDSGYVPTDDIAPAPNAQPALASSKKSHTAPPDFDQPNDVVLPSKQPPSDQPVPSFRY